jgi:thymidine phosphorylase
VVELTLALAREMLAGAGMSDVDPAEKLADGSAMDTWNAMIRAQGGDPDAALPVARETSVVTASADGVLTGWMLCPSVSPRGGWGRVGPGRGRRSRRVRASSCTPSRATR